MIRVPHPALRPFVKNLWFAEHPHRLGLQRSAERALPDGFMHIVIRLSDVPIRIADGSGAPADNYGHGVIGGARSAYYLRSVAGPTRSIGATLLPGAAQALFGPSAIELANRHTRLSDVWGTEADHLRERLQELEHPELQLDLFELHLLTRLPRARGLHPAIAVALASMHAEPDVSTLVARSGISHRRFVELFGNAVGLTPKRYARVRRFQQLLKMLPLEPGASWAQLAVDAGYSDQPHLNREFKEFSGMTPEEYRSMAPASPGHVPVTPSKRDQ